MAESKEVVCACPVCRLRSALSSSGLLQAVGAAHVALLRAARDLVDRRLAKLQHRSED